MSDFKVGDRVLISNRYGEHIEEIIKITPAGRFVTKNYKFDARGNRIGAPAYDDTLITLATTEDYRRINDRKRRTFIKNMDWSKLDASQISNIFAIINEYLEENKK